MDGELVPSGHELRMSDADRERAVERLNSAVAEGRLMFAEFEERVDAVLRARTYGELEPLLADLPDTAPAAREVAELRSQAANLVRKGRWSVPRKLVVRSTAGQVKLDLRHAYIAHREIEVELHAQAGSVLIILPHGASADIDAVNVSAGIGRTKVSGVPTGAGPHVVVTGSAMAGNLLVRHEYRFWKWTF